MKLSLTACENTKATAPTISHTAVATGLFLLPEFTMVENSLTASAAKMAVSAAKMRWPAKIAPTIRAT